MSYSLEVRIVKVHTREGERPRVGRTVASVFLDNYRCGPFYELVQSRTNSRALIDNPEVAIYPSPPDRQTQAVETIRDYADFKRSYSGSDEGLENLADDIEDGLITEDKFGETLGWMTIEEAIHALNSERLDELPWLRLLRGILLEIALVVSTVELSRYIVITYGS